MGDWQPIETVPKGEYVLVWVSGPEPNVMVLYAVDVVNADGSPAGLAWLFGEDEYEDYYSWNVQPTYWQPLPDGPENG